MPITHRWPWRWMSSAAPPWFQSTTLRASASRATARVSPLEYGPARSSTRSSSRRVSTARRTRARPRPPRVVPPRGGEREPAGAGRVGEQRRAVLRRERPARALAEEPVRRGRVLHHREQYLARGGVGVDGVLAGDGHEGPEPRQRRR